MSRDDGYTWEPARLLANHISNAGRVVEAEDGSLLIPLNGRYGDIPDGESFVMGSADRGGSWEPWGVVARSGAGLSFGEMRILPLGNGAMLAGMRTQTANFYVSHSDDDGKTWSPPEETSIYCRGSSPFDLIMLDDGRVLATYGHRRPPFGFRACLSEDGGRSWDVDNEIVLRDDGLDRDVGYPSSTQLIGRLDPEHLLLAQRGRDTAHPVHPVERSWLTPRQAGCPPCDLQQDAAANLDTIPNHG